MNANSPDLTVPEAASAGGYQRIPGVGWPSSFLRGRFLRGRGTGTAINWFVAVVFPAVAQFSAIAGNAVVNGDFSAGYVRFDTDYRLDEKLGWVDRPGDYVIGTDPKTHNSNFASFGDHTTGDGKMMIVNGATIANKTVWFQDDISVDRATDYMISLWAASAHADSPAILQLRLDHQVFGDPVTLGGVAGVWKQYSFPWRSREVGSRFSLAIHDTNLAAGGNDFVLDDISVTAVPEPSSVASMVVSMILGGWLVLRRRR